MPSKTNKTDYHLPRHLAERLKSLDHDRYSAYLMAPREYQKAFHILSLFANELTSISKRTPNPVLQEMQLQLWRDGLLSETSARSDIPVLMLTRELIETHNLPEILPVRMIDARQKDSDAIPFDNSEELLLFLEKNWSSFFQLSLHVISDDVEKPAIKTARLAGLAFGLTNQLRQFHTQLGKGRYLLLQSLPAGAIPPRQITPECAALLEGMNIDPQAANFHFEKLLGAAEDLYEAFVDSFNALPKGEKNVIRPAFYPLRIVKPLLKKLRKSDLGAFKEPEHFLRMWWMMRYRP